MRGRGTTRHEEPDPIAVEAADREVEHARRCLVQPRHVVDGDDDGLFGGGGSQDVEDGERDAQRLRRRGRGNAKQCRVERFSLGGGQVRHGDVEEGPQEIAERGERKAGLDLRGTRRDDAIAALVRGLDRGVPQSGLADPRLTREEDQPRALSGDRDEEPLDLLELVLAPEDRCHRPSLRRSRKGLQVGAWCPTPPMPAPFLAGGHGLPQRPHPRFAATNAVATTPARLTADAFGTPM